MIDCKSPTHCLDPDGCVRHWAERNEALVVERDAARLDAYRARVESTGLAASTVSTCLGLCNAEIRAKKAELRDCADLARRKRLVARIEQLRAALADLDDASLAAGALRREGER